MGESTSRVCTDLMANEVRIPNFIYGSAAGIPHAGLVMMVIILNAVNLPLEYTALVWAVDRVLDMCRTMTNVWSDSCGALVIAHSEKELDPDVLFNT